MPHPHVVRVLVLSLALLLATTMGVGVDAAFATCNCGNVCSCGSTVDVNTVLSSLDPVCSTTCPGTGLFVNAGITLDLGGCTLRGTVGSGNGVHAGAGAQVGGGKIVGFHDGVVLSGVAGRVSGIRVSAGSGNGIHVLGDANTVEKAVVREYVNGIVVVGHDNVVSHVQALNSGSIGVAVLGNGNRVEQSKALDNVATGIVFFGNDNVAASNRAQRNGFHPLQLNGFESQGDRNVFVRNVALDNDGCGLYVAFATSEDGRFEQNQSRGNRWGLCVDGFGHTISRNVVSDSATSGIVVAIFGDAAGNNVFERNKSINNTDFGILDQTTGTGTGGTANAYTGNVCSGNDLGDSSPAGLCR